MASSNVRVLGRTYRVETRKRMANAGDCNYTSALIRIKDGQDETERKDTTLHEVMHAILYQQGREYGGEVEETYVRALATGLIAVFNDNPGFAAWLATPQATVTCFPHKNPPEAE